MTVFSDEGIYNTYVIDTDYREWALIMHCAEKPKSNRYLSALMLSRTPSVGVNVINFLRLNSTTTVCYLLKNSMCITLLLFFPSNSQGKVAAVRYRCIIYVSNNPGQLSKDCKRCESFSIKQCAILNSIFTSFIHESNNVTQSVCNSVKPLREFN